MGTAFCLIGLFHLNIHGGGGVERSPIKKSWGEEVKMKELGVYMKIVGVSPLPREFLNGIALKGYVATGLCIKDMWALESVKGVERTLVFLAYDTLN